MQSNQVLFSPFLTTITGANEQISDRSNYEAATDVLLAPTRYVFGGSSIHVSNAGIEVKTHNVALRALAALALIFVAPVSILAAIIGSTLYAYDHREHQLRYNLVQDHLQKNNQVSSNTISRFQVCDHLSNSVSNSRLLDPTKQKLGIMSKLCLMDISLKKYDTFSSLQFQDLCSVSESRRPLLEDESETKEICDCCHSNSTSSASTGSSTSRLDNSDQLISLLVNAPEKLLEKVPNSSKSRMKDYPNIFECHCLPQLSRDKTNKRLQMEDAFIKTVQEKFPLPRKEPITLSSIASSGCFQELVLHAKLIKLGYSVNWILVDPMYYEDSKSPEQNPTYKEFVSLVKSISPDSQCEPSRDYEELFAVPHGLKPDVFMAIDVDLYGIVEAETKLVESDPSFVKQDPRFAAFVRDKITEANSRGETKIYIPHIAKIHLLVRSQPQSKIFVLLNRVSQISQEVIGKVKYFDHLPSDTADKESCLDIAI